MFCTNCGSQIEYDAKFCTNCGTATGSAPVAYQNNVQPALPRPVQPVNIIPVYEQRSIPLNQQININIPQVSAEKEVKGSWVRVLVGVISLVIYFPMVFYSCTQGIANTFSDRGDGGFVIFQIVSVLFLVAGIVSLACKKSKGGTIAAGVIFMISGLYTLNSIHGREDEFPVYFAWMCITLIFGVVMLISGAVQSGNKTNNFIQG